MSTKELLTRLLVKLKTNHKALLDDGFNTSIDYTDLIYIIEELLDEQQEENNINCPVCKSEHTRRDYDFPDTMRVCNECFSTWTITGEVLFDSKKLK